MSRNRYVHWVIGAIVVAGMGYTRVADLADQPGIILMEFIYDEAPFPQSHASTIVETDLGLVAAWFGGTRERNPDVGIWVSRNEGREWSPPVEVANGVQHDQKRYPCWNPVLFQPQEGPLLLFYKVGPSPQAWWGMVITSSDGGRSWSEPRRLPEDILGPVKNKPIQLPNGDLLMGSSTEHDGWRLHFERTSDLGKTWQLVGPINDGETFGVIQPTLLTYPDGRVQALNRSRQARIIETWSSDGGRTWSQLEATMLPNPSAGIDGVTLRDGRQLLVYNHTLRGGPNPRGREMLNVAISTDGQDWKAALVLENEPGEFSYPAVIQAADGLVHITYTWQRRRIRHVVLDPAKLVLVDMPAGRWPQ